MDAHITEMYKAYAKFTNAVATMLCHISNSEGKQTEATMAAMEEFNNQHNIFLAACDHAEDFVQYATKHAYEMKIAHHTKTMDPSANIMLKDPGQQIAIISATIQSETRMDYSVLGYKKCFDWEKEMVSDARGGMGGNVLAESLDTATSSANKI